MRREVGLRRFPELVGKALRQRFDGSLRGVVSGVAAEREYGVRVIGSRGRQKRLTEGL